MASSSLDGSRTFRGLFPHLSTHAVTRLVADLRTGMDNSLFHIAFSSIRNAYIRVRTASYFAVIDCTRWPMSCNMLKLEWFF